MSSRKLFYTCLTIIILLIPFAVNFYSKKVMESRLLASSKTDKTVIKFWQYWSGEEKEALLSLVNKFNQENHGFTVELQSISLPRKKVMMAIAANVPPDLVLLDGDMVTDFALRKALVPIKDFHENTEKFILPNYLEMLKIKNQQVALPIMPTAEALHINKTLLNKYGLKSPESLEDLILVSDSIIQKSNFKEFGWLPTWPVWSGRFIVTAFNGRWAVKQDLGSESGSYDYKITANSPENIRAWEWVLENFIKKIPQNKLQGFIEGNISYQSPDNPFYAGQVALETSGIWEHGFAKKFSPNYEVEIKAFPMTGTNSALNAPTEIAVDALAIPKGSKNPEKALYFMLWLLKKENANYLSLAQKKFPPLKLSTAEKANFTRRHPNPYINIFMDLAESSQASYFPHLSFSKEYKREIKKAFDKVLRLEMTPEEALNELQKKMEAVQKRSP